MTPLRRLCRNCYHWEAAQGNTEPNPEVSICTFQPPTTKGDRPQTKYKEWCGQWRWTQDPPPKNPNSLKARIGSAVIDSGVGVSLGALLGGALSIIKSSGNIQMHLENGETITVGRFENWNDENDLPKFVMLSEQVEYSAEEEVLAAFNAANPERVMSKGSASRKKNISTKSFKAGGEGEG